MKKKYRARFRTMTTVQVILLGASCLVFAWALLASELRAVPLVAGLAVLLQLVILIRFVESHVNTLEEFFAAVSYEDFTRRFVADDLDAELKQAFNVVLNRFQSARAERDVQAGYLETVVRHVPVPFMVARADGSLRLVNGPMRRMTGINALTRLVQFAELSADLPRQVQAVEPGGQQLLQTTLHGVPAELRVSVAEMRIDGEIERLYSIENLSGELTARESSAWRNLIRVLTHEIMNTLTPVTSLAQTTLTLIDDDAAKDDIRIAIQTIARRSDNLTQFVARYRELLAVPTPVASSVNVEDALRSVCALMQTEFEGVAAEIHVEPASLAVNADPALLDQVLVNLLRNALDAVAETPDPAIILKGRLHYGRIQIEVQDNGPGIEAEALEQVFVPFFTTRREGSGIGLSLCRQIMTAHGGEIVLCRESEGTVARLVF